MRETRILRRIPKQALRTALLLAAAALEFAEQDAVTKPASVPQSLAITRLAFF